MQPGVSGYPDLAVGPDGIIYCLYERGDDGIAHRHLTLARILNGSALHIRNCLDVVCAGVCPETDMAFH